LIVLIRPLLCHIRWIAIALLVTSVGTARTQSRVWLPQVVDGYTVTLSMAAAPAPPGNNQIVVTIHDPAGRVVVGAEVSLAHLRSRDKHALCSSRSASSINARVWRCWADLRP
jgi:hypothetical protein